MDVLHFAGALRKRKASEEQGYWGQKFCMLCPAEATNDRPCSSISPDEQYLISEKLDEVALSAQ